MGNMTLSPALPEENRANTLGPVRFSAVCSSLGYSSGRPSPLPGIQIRSHPIPTARLQSLISAYSCSVKDWSAYCCLSSQERATLKQLLQKLTDVHRFGNVPID